MPRKLPVARDLDLEELSRLDLAGGEITNVVLNAARLALQRDEHGPVTMTDFREALVMEPEGCLRNDDRNRIGFSLQAPAEVGSDNFDWRDLRGLGKLLGSMFSGPRPQARIAQ